MAEKTSAQIVPDHTLPVNSRVNLENNTFIIEGGTASGNNLFHSFREFSVPTNSTAYFNNATTIQNIFTRIIGSSISNIDGLIKANGSANLFVINPNGIIFGANAKLNIGGSFLASTANSFVFRDGSQFSAINPQSPPLLTVNVPIGLQFGTTPGEIIVQGTGHNLIIDNREAIIRDSRPDGLKVESGNTLALVGGNVTIEGGNITTIGGRVEIWSVANNQLSIANSNGRLSIKNEQDTNSYGNIQLNNAASIDVSGDGGELQLQGRQIAIVNGSTIFAVIEGIEQGRTLVINAAESLQIDGGTTTNDNQLFRSSLLSQSFGEGKAHDLIIETGQLIINGGQAAAFTFGSGKAGNLTIRARELVRLTDISTESGFVGGLFSQVKPEATGDGGDLTIETKRLIVRDGAQISTINVGEGKGGKLSIRAAESVEVIGSSADGVFASGLYTQSEGSKDSGDLIIETNQLIVQEGAQIATSTFGAGKAGNLIINAVDSVEVSGNSAGFSSSIVSQVIPQFEDEQIFPATGSGGNLSITTKRLLVADGVISASTFSEGQGGTVTINATNTVEIRGIALFNGDEIPSGLFATTESSGSGGNLTINTRRLIVQDGGQIAASTLSEGAGGTVTVNAAEFVQLNGIGKSAEGEVIRTEEGDIIRSGLFARTRLEGSGAAGSVEVNTPNLTVNNGATITVSSRLGSEDAAAGNLRVNANNIRLQNGIITAETNAGNFGNVDLVSRNIQLRDNSNITTSATGTGGNIGINTDILIALENSDITANSEDSRGGQININAQGIYRQGFIGTDVAREGSDRTSDITATSQLGPQFDGVVNLQTPDVDPTQSLINLPQIAVAPILQNLCAVEAGNEEFSEFVDVGRGGLPPNPREMVNLLTSANVPDPKEIVEAQGWVKDAKGIIHLVVQTSNVTPHSPQVSLSICNSRNVSGN
ncbi:hypothetical protein NIES2119_30140 [[Phormidium ambiguum] IAM M-71]|uniref:Filamentous haemagglutinin FhaB/tRNA nuclease CdiA-like TPS domain-containing protein n=1 Tax=[Phormidium ambiguum] IAM M-71 TaxID=454136 RepID=A0A1U7I3Y2_9CYAN|nr:filamentous hemagglutinin N-terminal domain-containing protein [Phormidium ambiguum]OKH30836.1 hypothetical protein NIES2119_30140 [Phormidium ambiguum IAM M-71]